MPTQWQYQLEDILDEQYAFLRVHAEKCKVDGCKHCWRMDRLKEILMMPFRNETEYPIGIAKKKGKIRWHAGS